MNLNSNSLLKNIRDDLENIADLFKENIFGIIIIFLFTLFGIFLGLFWESRQIVIKNISFEVDIQNSDYAPSHIVFQRILSNYFSIFDTNITFDNKQKMEGNPIFFYNNNLDFQSPAISSILSSVNINKKLRVYTNTENSLLNFGFDINEIELIKDFKYHDLIIERGIEIINLNLSDSNLIEIKLFSEKFRNLIKEIIKKHINDKISQHYTQFINQIEIAIGLLESNNDIVQKISERKKQQLIEFIDKQIDLAESFGIYAPSTTHESACPNYNPITERKYYLSSCFLYGKKYLEFEKNNLISTPIEFFEPILAKNSELLIQLYSLKKEAIINHNQTKLQDLVNSNKFDLITNPIFFYSEDIKNTYYNKNFFGVLFFVLGFFIVFFLGVIKYQKKFR